MSVSTAAESSNQIYSQQELQALQVVPRHLAIIMDGNRRWAKERGMPPVMGHWEGAEVLTEMIQAAAELGIKTVTVYAFSTENWGRPTEEIESLMNLFEVYLKRKKDHLIQEGVRLDSIGDIRKLPQAVFDVLADVKEATRHGNRINLVLAINYGARDEIRRAIGQILKEHEKQPITENELTEEFVARHLDTHRYGDPDLLIRTSGEHRLSNFLLWQICYSELYVTNVLWPDFSEKELYRAMVEFQKRSRRLGG